MVFSVRRHLITNGVVALAVVALALWSISRGDLAGGLVVLVGTAVGMWWIWPTRGPHLDEAEAKQTMGPDDVIVYWRPGCMHCARLALTSRLARWPAGSPRRFRVNVWRDPDAATSVQLLRGGFQTVPTVIDADGELIVPTPAGIKRRRRIRS